MKKIFTVTAILAAMCIMTSCGDKKGDNSQSESSVPETATTSEAAETTAENADTTQAETVSTKSETSISTEKSVNTSATSAAVNDDSAPFLIAAEGGIVFPNPIEDTDDSALIAGAQKLFEQACETEWNFTVGSPYEVDQSVTVKNSYGWDCYLVTSEGITSLDDVRLDYHKIFSENYEDNHLEEVFTEYDGRLYCLCGERGSNIFYIDSKITAVNSRSDSEISFTVTDSYSDDDFGGGSYAEEREFAISFDSDQAWHVSKFILPY